MKEYKVITAITEAQLAHRVNAAIREGFELVGGCSVCVNPTDRMRTSFTYAQAMIKVVK